MRDRTIAGSVMVGLMLVTAACGDGSGAGSSSTPTPAPTTTPVVSPPSVERLSGVYDTDDRTIAVVSGSGTLLHLVIGTIAETATDVSGVLRGDGSAELSGERRAEDVPQPPVRGTVVVSESDGAFRIDGAIGGNPVHLVRPILGPAQNASNIYFIEFNRSLTGVHRPSRTLLILDIFTDGRTPNPTPEVDEIGDDGEVLGTLSGGQCLLSPSLLLSCRYRYRRASGGPFPPGDRFDVVLTGSLAFFEDIAIEASGIAVATNVPPITTHVLALTAWSGNAPILP